ncbi:hypothetical protein [Streptomyces endophyticus]|uniref:Uncharacterized protein n=1 Tax=Streptomyces endophyticus TaxID=714166 RepID=A0ABU6FA13_9ACTN|nr:hypothetical protein [Streptomyces endophyticus]MEB8340773.1 hypothetical protein [Streptomyces endophyticus]
MEIRPVEIRGIDPRDTTWEQDHANYRVYFWDRSTTTSYEYELLGDVDVDEVLAWAEEYATARGWARTVYAVTMDGDRRGLIRLAGVLGDPFAQ